MNQQDHFKLRDSGKRKTYSSGAMRERNTGKGRFDLISPFALMRLALIYEKGAMKYDDRNWEKGEPFTRFIDSAMRHIVQYMQGDREEDHLAQAAWNLFSILHLEATMPEWDDMPDYLKKKKEQG